SMPSPRLSRASGMFDGGAMSTLRVRKKSHGMVWVLLVMGLLPGSLAAGPADPSHLKGGRVNLKGREPFTGYLAKPAGKGPFPGVVVIIEWWGLNDQIKGVADRLAGLGYRAMVPDLYKGKVTLDAAEAQHLMTNLDFGQAASQDIRGAAQYLKQSSAKVGVVGFCMGGALTVLAAVFVND